MEGLRRWLRPARAVGLCLLVSPVPAAAQGLSALAAIGAPQNPRVQVTWDRYYDHAAIGEIGRRLQAAWPDRCRLGSIGKSYEGREIWLLTVTNFKHGNVDAKPAMYIDGNIHSNEVQGTEIALYTAWYLCEMADQVPYIDSLLDQRVFYIVPTINPDGREHFLHQPDNPNSPRSGMAPRDNDGDGLVDEDGYDDLNGDGYITQMRRRNPNGRWITSPEDPRIMIPAPPDQPGEWELLGYEGYDNDGDGLVNEDGPEFSYDPNRNWPWRWQPQYVQGGADYYPTSLPETRAVMAFVRAHPNIAGAQSYHNNGGMILRGPGMQQDSYKPEDVRVYDVIGHLGEQILPGYHYYVVWKDLYTVWGGELDWFYGARGVVTFSNELWTAFEYFSADPGRERYDRVDYKFDRLLLMGEAVVPWTPVEHPQYGHIEVGGLKKQYGRAVPAFLLPAEAHRNMAFTVYQADQMPLVSVDSIATRSLGNGLTEVTAIIANKRLVRPIPDRTSITTSAGPTTSRSRAARWWPDLWWMIPGPTWPGNRSTGRNAWRSTTFRGWAPCTVRWIVRGAGPFTVTADSQKGGVGSRTGR